jgi:hypothetical protein
MGIPSINREDNCICQKIAADRLISDRISFSWLFPGDDYVAVDISLSAVFCNEADEKIRKYAHSVSRCQCGFSTELKIASKPSSERNIFGFSLLQAPFLAEEASIINL